MNGRDDFYSEVALNVKNVLFCSRVKWNVEKCLATLQPYLHNEFGCKRLENCGGRSIREERSNVKK